MPRPRKGFIVQNGGSADIEVARARDNYVYDTRGRKYIDFIMGWCVGNFGWARPDLRRRVHAFDGPDYVYPEYAYKRWRELAQLLVGLAPKGLTRCCRATGGSEAVELALPNLQKVSDDGYSADGSPMASYAVPPQTINSIMPLGKYQMYGGEMRGRCKVKTVRTPPGVKVIAGPITWYDYTGEISLAV